MKFKSINSVRGLERKEYKVARQAAAKSGCNVVVHFAAGTNAELGHIKVVEPIGKVRGTKVSDYPAINFADKI